MSVGTGDVIAFGATNARVAEAREGEIYGFRVEDTPTEPRDFFAWSARNLLEAADAGKGWVVLGLPGPVDGHLVGPMPNIEGLKAQRYDIAQELVKADSAVADVLADEKFTFAVVNDGPLVAHAVAAKIGENKYCRPSGLIIGTGVGVGILERDARGIYRTGNAPAEIGHEIIGSRPADTIENSISATALSERHGDPRLLEEGHPAWATTGQSIGKMALSLGLREGADLVVPTGGVGIGASAKYGPHLNAFLDDVRENGNGPQQLRIPEVKFVPLEFLTTLEMYGAEGVIRDIRNPQV